MKTFTIKKLPLYSNQILREKAKMLYTSPTPAEILELRKDYQLTQTEAAELIWCSLGAWQKWEYGTRKMHRATWFALTARLSVLI